MYLAMSEEDFQCFGFHKTCIIFSSLDVENIACQVFILFLWYCQRKVVYVLVFLFLEIKNISSYFDTFVQCAWQCQKKSFHFIFSFTEIKNHSFHIFCLTCLAEVRRNNFQSSGFHKTCIFFKKENVNSKNFINFTDPVLRPRLKPQLNRSCICDA